MKVMVGTGARASAPGPVAPTAGRAASTERSEDAASVEVTNAASAHATPKPPAPR
ncbi:hypothetical protein [Gordonia hongkongensis]|uniref:hypothetical protein n=1 Tax=Gordonia hongkongensis TaxID=1701090 RepID=UPI003D764EB6